MKNGSIFLVWAVLLSIFILAVKVVVDDLVVISDNYTKEKMCEDYAIMHNKDVQWMSGYKICFNVKTGKAIKLEVKGE